MRSHHSLYNDIFEIDEEQAHHRQKLTWPESIIALAISLTCVSFMAIYLVDGIPYLVEHRGVKDAYVSPPLIHGIT